MHGIIPRFLILFSMVGILYLDFSNPSVSVAQVPEKIVIQDIITNPAEATITLIARPTDQFKTVPPWFTLSNPPRWIADLPNTTLAPSLKRNERFSPNSALQQWEIQTGSNPLYPVSRLTVTAIQPKAWENIQIVPSGNRLQVRMPALAITPFKPNPSALNTAKSVLSSLLDKLTGEVPSTAANGNTIQSVRLDAQGVSILSTGNQPLKIKNRFTLSAPDRLVVDFADTALAEKQMAPLYGSTESIRTVRVGQFDETTVRVVIESATPKRFSIEATNPERTTLAIRPMVSAQWRSPQSTISAPPLSQIGALLSIDLNRGEDNQMSLVLKASEAINRQVINRPNRIEIQLTNINARYGTVEFDRSLFPDITAMRIEALQNSTTGSKLVIDLTEKTLQASTKLLEGGQRLEVTIASNPIGDNPPDPQTIWIANSNDDTNPIPTKKPKRSTGNYLVVVDAGHGGKDIGANREGVYEKELNLSVALKLRKALQARGIQVVMTRESDVFIPLPDICAITNRNNPDAFVSIHTNASVNPQLNGIETYYYTPQSKAYADVVHRKLTAKVPAKDNGVRRAKFYVVHHTPVPAVLVEMGYISNPIEREDLQTEARQQATADAVAQGVVTYLKGSKPD